MPKFGYTEIIPMEPRPGRRYATDYYRQNPQQRRKVVQHIERSIRTVEQHASGEPGLLDQPLKDFPKENRRQHYSTREIMTNLRDQLAKGHDVCSGMLGRWNRLLTEAGLEIEMVPEDELPPPNQFGNLFS